MKEVSMNRLASAALAGAFFAATGGIALAAQPPASAASTSPANAATASVNSTASAMARPQGARGADNSPTSLRMTHALNLLEAKGYGDFHNFRQDGKNFDATVTRAGKQASVQVDPDTDQVTVQG
jgi:hypothetical protein